MLDYALRYASLGWRLVPITKGAKAPCIARWQKVASSEENTLRRWFREHTEANLGVATGHQSGVLALDIDRKGGLESMARLVKKYDRLPTTATQMSGGGGYHYFFRWPQDKSGQPLNIRNSAGLIAPGVDMRGEGGQILLAPSRHPSGRKYRWQKDHSPWDLDLAAPPQWLLTLCRKKRKHFKTAPGKSQGKGLISEGSRNDTLFSIAGKLRVQGFSEQEIMGMLSVSNRERCQPPLPETEIAELARKICRYPAGKRKVAYQSSKRKRPPTKKAPNPDKTETSDREPALELLKKWLLGKDGPQSLDLIWREGDKAYGMKSQRLVSRSELREVYTNEILDWLLENAFELETLPKNKETLSAAISIWKRWIGSAYFYVLNALPAREKIGAITETEEMRVRKALYKILTAKIRITNTKTDIPFETTILDEANTAMNPGWNKVGRFGAFVRKTDSSELPFIALRYDMIVQNGEKWLSELKRKSLAALLKKHGVAKSKSIRESPMSTVRCYLIEPDWLREWHGSDFIALDLGIDSPERKDPG